jgi:hypothetical protein
MIFYQRYQQTNSLKWRMIKEDSIKDVDDDNIGMKINKQVPLKDLNPTKARFNYN